MRMLRSLLFHLHQFPLYRPQYRGSSRKRALFSCPLPPPQWPQCVHEKKNAGSVKLQSKRGQFVITLRSPFQVFAPAIFSPEREGGLTYFWSSLAQEWSKKDQEREKERKEKGDEVSGKAGRSAAHNKRQIIIEKTDFRFLFLVSFGR